MSGNGNTKSFYRRSEIPPHLIEYFEEIVPAPTSATILDPFAGSGTTLQVARQLGRNSIGLDLSFDYLHDQARERLGFVALDEWQNGKNGAGEPLEALPLFEGLPDA